MSMLILYSLFRVCYSANDSINNKSLFVSINSCIRTLEVLTVNLQVGS